MLLLDLLCGCAAVHMRVWVQELPPLLLLHLKRFQPRALGPAGAVGAGALGFGGRGGGGGGGGWVKLDTHVTFPTHLDMAPFCQQQQQQQQQQQGESGASEQQRSGGAALAAGEPAAGEAGAAQYRLVGLVEHQGSMKSGHYVAYVRRAMEPAAPAPSRPATPPPPPPAPADGGVGPDATDVDGGDVRGEEQQQQQQQQEEEQEEEQWFCISDAHAHAVSEARVLGAQAYLLMYERL